MKTRRNSFLAMATLIAATVLLAGQQAAFAIDYNLDSFTGPQSFIWNTDASWNPDATGGTGPLAVDSVVISGGNLTGTTTINYATGSAATREITNITVSDSVNGSGSGANLIFGAGVTGSALQFSTTTPTVSTNIINQNSGGNRVNIENPLFQSGTTFTKGSVGNVQLKMTSAASVTSFNNNVSTLTSTGAGALFLSATGAATAVTLPTISLGANNTGLILASGTFTATDKTIALGTGRLVMGIGSTLNLTGSSTISGGVVTLGSTASGDFNIGSGNSVINMNGATATFVDLLSTGLKDPVINTYNQQGGTTNISGTATLGNPGNTGSSTSNQTLAINMSGGSFNFTRTSGLTDFAVGVNTTRSGAYTNAVTLNGSVTVSSSGLLDLGAFTRIVLGTDTSTYADNITATLNLNGGTLKTAREILRGTNNGVGGTDSTLVKLNGGTLQTTAAIPELFTSFGDTSSNGILVSNGGAVIDTNGFNSGTATVLQENTASTGGGLTKNGTGTLTLGAANTYTGATDVIAGRLLVNGDQSAATGTVSVSANATLGGSGSIGGAVNVSTGGYLAPGASAGNLTLKNGLTMGGIFSWDLGALSTSNPGTDFDTVTITAGNADITGASLGLNLGANAPSAIPFWQTNQTWSGIIDNTGSGTLTGVFAAIDNSAWSSLGSFSITYTANDVNLTWTAVPAPPPPSAQVDQQINRSVWKQKFGVLDAQMNEQVPYAGWLSLDSDGDGIKNRDEFIAGTNPFPKGSSEASFRPPVVTGNPTTLSLTFPTVPGKLYGVESNMNLVETWAKGTLPSVVGDGTSKTLVAPKSAGNFFRVTVTDQATQGDQVSDWAKHMLGLSPNSPITSQTSFDSSSLAANLETQNVVSLRVIDTDGTQPMDGSTPAADFALIRVTRSGSMNLGPVTIPISKTGTAVAGVDFASLPTSLTFPTGVNSLDVKITPLFNASRTSSATVFLTIASPGSAGAGGNYTLGSSASAGVTIYPSGDPTGTGLTASYYPGSSTTYTNAANFGGAAATYSYTKANTTTGSAIVTYTGTPVTAYTIGSQVTLQFTSSNLNVSPYNSAANYTITALPTATSFSIAINGTSVPSGPASGNVTIGAFGAPLTRLDPLVDFTWSTGSPDPSIPTNNFSARWTGQVLPQYSQTYFFVTKADDGSKLWVNNQLVVDQWASTSEKTGSIVLQAGVRYDIKMEYNELTGSAGAQLSWYSNDQAKQIIPTKRLFPTISGSIPLAGNPLPAPPAITSSTSAIAIHGAGTSFTMNLTSSNGGTITASGLPPWLTLVNGILSGTPPAAGIFQFTLTTTNASGTSSVVMTLEVLATPNQFTRERWTSGVTGPAISNVPWTTPPSSSDTVITAESNASYADNTGERLRGYFTAPATGNYYFWIAASNAAELWISNNAEPVNKVLRAKVTGPTGTSLRTWNAQTTQKSQWLSLIAGKKYYIEALHNTGASGSASHLSVAWFLDPTGNTASPIANACPPAAAPIGGVIPGDVLSPWDNPPTTTIPGTLYVTNLQGVDGLSGITGTGGAFLRVNGSTAVIQLNYTGLSSGATSKKIFKRINSTTSQVIFDIDAQDKNYPALKTSDGGYTWTMQASDLTDLDTGKVYLGISTLNHPAGELTGTFRKIAGSQTAPPVPAYPTWTSLHATSDADNSRFLTQATFGPSPSDINEVKISGYRPWIESQFTAIATKNVPYLLENLTADPENPYPNFLMFNSWWKNSVTAPDQLRQRAAFALSEILVVSDDGPLDNNGRVLAGYYDTLLDSCFGNFRDILKQVTLSPAMGVYLDMRANALGSIITGLHPNENYAREILQLFSVGLYKTWPDGTLVLDSSGSPVATYDQEVVTGMARVFTGWNWGQALQGSGRLPTYFYPPTNYLDPMVLVPTRHELGSKVLLDNVILPPAVNTDSATALLDTIPISIQTTHPTSGQGLPVTTPIFNQYDLNGLKDLEATLDNIMANSSVGPYICRQLIQRLVTSHPKPEYVHRVVRAFNGEQNVDNIATGVRGDMKDVFRAILLDYEARSTTAAADSKYGKQREPLLRVTGPARAFPAASFPNSTYSQNGLQTITVTTPTPHRLISGESVRLANFLADSGSSSAQLPTTQAYTIGNVTANSFTVGNTATSSLNYTISGNTAIIDPTGVIENDKIYVKFTTGGLAGGSYDGVYTVGISSGTKFTVPLLTTPSNTTGGSCLIPKLDGGYNISGNAGAQTILIQTSGNHNLVGPTAAAGVDPAVPGDLVQLKFLVLNSPVGAASGVYEVSSIVGPNSFRVAVPATPVITSGIKRNSVNVYPLKGSHWTRNGTVTVELSTWNIGSTPVNLNQTPLRSPTVFNFFYPDYQFPGEMAQAGMTTPEFQLSNDSNTMYLTNLITGGTLSNNSGNANGYIGIINSSNAITMDLAPYMTLARTSNAGIPTLVNDLGVLLTGGNLTSAVKSTISNYVIAHQSYTTPTPTITQMRNRVRAIVHLIATSAGYAIQR